MTWCWPAVVSVSRVASMSPMTETCHHGDSRSPRSTSILGALVVTLIRIDARGLGKMCPQLEAHPSFRVTQTRAGPRPRDSSTRRDPICKAHPRRRKSPASLTFVSIQFWDRTPSDGIEDADREPCESVVSSWRPRAADDCNSLDSAPAGLVYRPTGLFVPFKSYL